MKPINKNLLYTFIILGVGIIGGIVLGMTIQQMIFIAGAVEFAEGLEGTNIEINVALNETQLVEGFTKFFNETLIEENDTKLYDLVEANDTKLYD